MKNLLLWLTLSSFFASCNIYSGYVKKQAEVFEEAGMERFEKISDRPGELFSGETYIEFKTVYMTGPERFDSTKKNLLLIHGYQGGAIAQWSPNVEELSKHFNIVAPDLNCHGNTYFSSDYSIEMQVDMVNEMLQFNKEKWANENLIVIGGSYGGLVGARFAEKYPEKVSAYVSLDGLTGCYNRSFTDSVAQSVGVPNAVALLNPTTGKELKKLASLEKPMHTPSFILNQVVEQHFKVQREHKIALLEYLNKHESELNNHTFQWKCPVYLVWGENDKIIPLSSANCLKQKYQIPEDHVFVYPKTGHIPNMQNPKAFNKWVIDTFSN
jgi:pimeloyl-ACP methyl ester carboxylesterase